MIPFSRFNKIYFLISSLVLIPGIFSLIRFGLKPSIDFTGGGLIQYQFEKQISNDEIYKVAQAEQIEISSVQFSDNTKALIRTSPINQDKELSFRNKLQTETSQKITQLRFETIGPILGKELIRKTFIAIIVSIIVILFYIAWSFKNILFGVSAIVALIHDLLVLIGVFSLFGHFLGIEIDSLFVTAVLTTTSFSVHDTIVVNHRILEIRKKNPRLPLKEASDLALSETIVRSLNNSLTIIFMLLALVLLGGVNIRWFAVALLVGTITGTYSSAFVATPLVNILEGIKNRRKIK